jgi:hypothetical protein
MPRVTVAVNDLALASLGNDFAQLTYDQPRNGVINGSFEIWQRGTSGLAFGTSAANGFMADRWQAFRTGFAAGATGSQTAGTAQTRYALRLTRTAGNTSLATMNCLQNIETANAEVYAGQQVTFSLWARRGADYAGTTNLRILSGTGIDQNVIGVGGFTGQATVVSSSRTITTTWQRFSVTGTVASTATELAVQLQYTPTTATAGANDWIEFTGAQLEIGAVPSTFQMNGGSVAAELANCQRYYQRHGLVSGAFLAIGYGSGTTTTNTFWSISPAMRIAPTSVAYTNVELVDGAGGTIAVTGLALHNPTPTRAIVHVTHAVNDTAHRPYGLRTTSAAGYVELNAEI